MKSRAARSARFPLPPVLRMDARMSQAQDAQERPGEGMRVRAVPDLRNPHPALSRRRERGSPYFWMAANTCDGEMCFMQLKCLSGHSRAKQGLHSRPR